MASSQASITNQTHVDTTAVFTTTQKFATREAVVEWAREVGFTNKVTINITRSDTKTGKRGRSDKLILGCDRGGKYEAESLKKTANKKCDCPFKIRSTPSTDGSGWKVEVRCGIHNHELPDRYEGHPRVGRLTEDEKKHVADLTKCRVAPRNILLSLQRQNPESVTHINQIYKNRQILQQQERGPKTEMQQLLQLLDDAKYVCWSRRRDNDSEILRDIFWAHPDSIKLLNMFPIVLIMDSTYKTNKYRQPLLEIVGITSTDKTFVVGFGYMECEKMENYCWVLEKLKGLFIKQDLFPHVILTDRELALMNAIEVVFPHAVNLLCTWHINKNVNARCGAHLVKDMRKLVKQLWQNIVFSQDEVEYQQRLNEFEQACAGSSKFLDYVNDTWLNPHRQRFVEAWTNRVMHLGNTTTNRYDYAYFTKMYFV
jgi:hypothetical protein